VARLARWAEPSRGRPRSPFRSVGYVGTRGHGRRLHLSWRRAGTRRGGPARVVYTLDLARARR
jgi:hypothetical protein